MTTRPSCTCGRHIKSECPVHGIKAQLDMLVYGEAFCDEKGRHVPHDVATRSIESGANMAQRTTEVGA